MITEETKIHNTELSKQTKNILSRCRIYNINDLINIDIQRLYRIYGLGSVRINEIIFYLGDNGFFLKG